jgi:hypothetical protein
VKPTVENSTLQELQLLKRQLQSAIEIEQSQQMKQMTEKEVREHVEKYGHGAFLIGDFVIKRR